MCGIFSFINIQKKSLTKKQLNTLMQYFMLIKHRGPDETRFKEIDTNIVFGFHRLSINGLDLKSGQPLQHRNLYLIANAEIFNYEELANKYKFKLDTKSDCEIILHLYDKFGIDETVKQLDGEFVFCLYDKDNEKVYIARDHIGIRPLFIGNQKENIMIASEARSLVYQCTNVKQYSPGFYSTIDMKRGERKDIQHYSFDYKTIYYDRKQVMTLLKQKLIKSVKDRMMSDRPLGSFLSGGLDSSLVTSIASQFNPDIHVFTVGLKDSVDIIAAKKVAKYLNLTNHHIVNFTVDQGIDCLRDVIYALESYDITTVRASVGQYILSKYIKENTDVRVLLSGECIDEFCNGYQYNKLAPTSDDLHKDSIRLIKELHMYDILRTDRTTAQNSLEVRVPFASRDFLDFIMNIDPNLKQSKTQIEKKIIRDSFIDNYLPDEILYRIKAAFSDAVSSKKVSWYKAIVEHAEKEITDKEYNEREELYPYNTPVSKESFIYRKIFESIFPNSATLIDHLWMPKFQKEEITDPSATVLKNFVTND